jgi:filamentous hemagglutinin family protein
MAINEPRYLKDRVVSQPPAKFDFLSCRWVSKLGTLLLASTALTPLAARANPQNGTVINGNATIAQPAPNTVEVIQQSSKAIINWQSFSIAPGESTIYQQPSPSSIALNRVTGLDPSSIAGTLKANGIVFLVNPNGVIFTKTAHVDVHGIVASTADIADSDFMAGQYNFTMPGNPNASIINEGTITARDRGLVGLVAPSVRNDGTIAARLGRVSLASGEAFALDLLGDQLIQFAVPVFPAGQPTNNSKSAAVTNTGTIKADGGTVWLGVDTAKRVVDHAINSTGIIEATAVHQHDGIIVLDGGPGLVSVSGTLNASGQKTGQTGGTVQVLGGNVILRKTAKINVSGDVAGGTVMIGGNFHGAGPERNAAKTIVAKGAMIDADALTSGNGGQIVVWSDQTTSFNGTILARGGAISGNGGFVETSGKQNLSVLTGDVDTSAAHGAIGNWLLDPAFILISNGGLATLSDVNSFTIHPGTTQFISPNAIGSAFSNVLLEATDSITFNSPITMLNNGVGITALAGRSISVQPGAGITTRGGNITFVANDPLTLQLGDSGITIGAPLATNGGGLIGGAINLQISGGTGFGVLSPGASLTTAGGPITIGGQLFDLFGVNAITNTLFTIDTTGAGSVPSGAKISFTNPLGSQFFGRQQLTLRAGSGDINFGGTVDVGGLDIVSARNVTASSFITANSFFTDTQTGNLVIPGGISTSGQSAATVPGNQNAGPVNLVVGGNATIGTDSNSRIIAFGGYTAANGAGGNGADVSIEVGGMLTLSGIATNGGTPKNGSALGGNAGDISLTAPVISLLGYAPGTFSGVPNLTLIALNADGGPTTDTTAFITQPAGRGGNITVNGNLILGGGPGTSVHIDNISNGSNTNITINGQINATTPDAESLELADGHGQISVGNIGSAVRLNSVFIGDNVVGTIGSVTADSLTRVFSSTFGNFGSTTTTFTGPVNITGNASLSGANLIFDSYLIIGGAATFNTANLTAQSVTVRGATTIAGDTVISTNPLNGSLTFASIDGAQPYVQALTLNAGQFGTLSIGLVGTLVPLRSFSRIPAAQPAQQVILTQVQNQTSALQITPLASLENLTFPAIQEILSSALYSFGKLLPGELGTEFESDAGKLIQDYLGTLTDPLTITEGSLSILGLGLGDLAAVYIQKATDEYALDHNVVETGIFEYTLQVEANTVIDYVTTPELWPTGSAGLGAALGAGIVQSTATELFTLGQVLIIPAK